MQHTKIGIIGIGNVGTHVLYTLALQGLAEEFVLIDTEEKNRKVVSERQDVFDCAIYLPHHVNITIGDFQDLGDCDIIVNCCGQIDLLRTGHNRITEMKFNLAAVRGFADKINASGFQGIVVNVSNPCDIITRELAALLNLPKGRVFGTGTGLDTARLIASLSAQLSIDAKSIVAYMLGEHGNDQFAPWSCVNFNGKSLDDWAKTDSRFQFDRNAAEHAAVEGGWVTFGGKFHTDYAIALTVSRIIKIIVYNEQSIIPASVELNGEYGEKGIFAGVPALIGRNGVEEVIEFPLTEHEKKRFHECCEGIRKNIALDV